MRKKLAKLRQMGERVKKEIGVYRLVLKDRETPLIAKTLLWIAVLYALSPVDLIPDFIPVLGYLDDAVILPVLFVIALRFIPKEIIDRHRKAAGKKR